MTKRSAVAGPSGMQRAADQQQGAVHEYLNKLGGSYTMAPGAPQMTGAPKMDFRTWYSGQNLEGTNNGWDTDFQRTFQSGMNRAYEQGRVFDYFTDEKATGVVTWDNARGRGDQTYRFGDVVVGGERVGNVYEDFDRHTANVMMGDYLVQTGARKAELNEASDVEKAWEEELAKLRAENTKKAEVAPRAQKFEEDVRERLEEDDERDKVVFSGATGGAVIGAGVGSFFTPVGTAIGAGVGFVLGGLGAWLNSDSLTYQLARSKEQYELAAADGAKWQAAMSMVSQNVYSIGLSPVTNLYRGTYDALGEGGVGGGTLGGEFFETNAEGQRKAGAAWQIADFGAMIADSALQFASPAGRLAYQAQMTAQIGSGVIGLMPGQGMWDDRMVKQNSVWTRDEYNPETGQFEQKFDLGNALAGIGMVGIDAVQLGAISSLSRQSDRLAAQVAKRTGTEPGRWAKPFAGNTPFEKLNLSKAQRQALREGGEIETRSGFKFVLNESGEIVGRQRATLAMLAPSEGLNAMSAKLLARRDAARRNGAVSAEQLYQAATDLAIGQRGIQAMLVNAVGEGQEEVIQAVLEPWSQDHAVDAEEVMRAGLTGAASGFGMTFGARLGRPSQDLQMFQLGRAAHMAQTNGDELSYEQWSRMDHLQKRALAKSAGSLAKSLTDAAFDKIESDRVRATVGGVVEAMVLEDYQRAEAEASLDKGTEATDQASPIVMHESYTFRPEALATSHTQMLRDQQERTRGARIQLERLGDDIAKTKQALARDPQDAELAAALERQRDSHRELAEVLAASEVMEQTIELHVRAITTAFENDDAPLAERIIDGLNDTLEQMYDMSTDTFDLARDGAMRPVKLTDAEALAFAKAASRLATRDPADSTGSWQVMLPQVHKVFAYRQADGVYAVSQIVLKAIRGDYDGDKMRELQQLILEDEEWTAIRSGANILGVGNMPEIASTKFEQQLVALAMRYWKSGNGPLRQAARKIGRDIETALTERYVTPGLVPAAVIDEVSAAVKTALKTGGDAREAVLEVMSRRAGNALSRMGRGENWQPGMRKRSNEMYWMANMVTQAFSEFQSAYATYTPKKGKAPAHNTVTAPAQTRTDAKDRAARRAATEAANLINEAPGDNAFRMFQKLHYTLWESTEKHVGFAEEASNQEFVRLVQFYERLSQSVTEQRLDRKSPSEVVIGRAMEWLAEGAIDPAVSQVSGADMATLANMRVGQMVYAKDSNGNMRLRFTGKSVSLAQHLLYLSVEQFKRDNSQVWDSNTDLRAAYNNILELTKPQTQGDESSHPGNAEMAFVRMFDSVQLYDIVGADALSLGVNRTVGQVYRDLLNLSVEERRQQKYALRSGVYADAEKGFTIPFGQKEVDDGSVTAYKSLVDSLFSAADSSLSQNLTGKDKGKVHGRYAKKSAKRGEAIRDAYTEVQRLLQRLYPKSGRYTAEDISRIANENQEFGLALLRTIPKEAMPWTFKGQDDAGNVRFASWFYEVWTQPTAVQAEMSFFRNLVLDSWYARVRGLDIDSALSDKGVEKRVSYDALTSRMHRLIFKLSSQSTTNPLPLKAFLARFEEASSVEEFMEYVNSEPGLVTEGAPLLAWMDDVAEFDPERAGGGWATQLSTPTLIESINDLRSAAHRIVGDIDKAAARADKDVETARAIERWHKHLQNPDDQDLVVDRNDERVYKRFTKLLERAAQRRMTNGPRAMLQHTAHLVHGLYAPAHAKGAIAEQMAANAALEQMDNAFGYLTQAERILGDLTTHNEDAVAGAPQMILRDGGRTMTRDGSQVEWEMRSVEAMLPLMLKPENHAAMRAILFDTVVELDADNVARRKHLMGSTLDEVLNGTSMRDLFGRDNPNLTQSMKYLAKLDAELRDTQKHMLEQKVTELVIARTTALDHQADFAEIQAMTVQAYMDMAALLQTIGRTQVRPGEEDPVVEAHRRLRETSLVAAISASFGLDVSVIDTSMKSLQLLVERELLSANDKRLKRLRDQMLEKGRSRAELDDLNVKYEAEQKLRDGMQAKIKRMFDLNITEQIVAQYSYSKNDADATKFAQQTALMEYVYEHGELMQAAGPALPVVQAIKNHFAERPKHNKLKPLRLPEKDWETLSSVIISVEIQHLLTVGPASKTPPPYPAPLKPGSKGLDTRKYWDHSFSYLLDFMAEDASDGIVAAARKLAVDAGTLTSELGAVEVQTKALNTVLKDGTLGQWTEVVPIQSIESWEMLTGASANPSISMHGLISQRWGAAMIATERQTTDTVADATVTLTGRDLNWMQSNFFHDVTMRAGNGQDYQRPLAWFNNRFAEELTVTYADPSGNRVQPINLMDRFNVAREWLPAAGEPAAERFREVNIERLRDELAAMFTELHPGATTEAVDRMLESVEVSMRFVNPDAKPSTAKHANSVWHEGTVYSSDGDVGPSLLTAFFYGVGALNARGQQAALDTRKLGLSGIEDYQRPEYSKVRQIEEDNRGLDFSRMIALKTELLMDTPISNGKPIDIQFYNAALKLMMLKHWVEGIENGRRVRWSAEQVIEWQQQNPGKDFFTSDEAPLQDARLWIPSDQVLADMMGDMGFGGVRGRALKDAISPEVENIDLYTSRWSALMEQRFPVADSRPKTLMETDVARQAYVQDLSVSSYVTPQERTKFAARVENMQVRRSKALQRRVKDAQRKTFDPAANRQTNLDIVTDWVAKSDLRWHAPPGFEYLEMEQDDLLEKTLTSVDGYLQEQQAKIGDLGLSLWIFQEDGMSSPEQGRLIKSDLRGKLTLVPGEIVYFDTASYDDYPPDKARELALERISYFVSQNVALMIGSSTGRNSLTSELQQLTQQTHGYVRYDGNNSILIPDVFDEGTFQNIQASRSRLTNPTAVPISRQRLSMLLLEHEVEENSMWVPVRPGRQSKFDSIQAIFDLLPIDVHSRFGSARTRDDAERVLRQLKGLGTGGVEMLRKEALRGLEGREKDKADSEFSKAWDRLMVAMEARVRAGTTRPLVGEDFGTGDFIPLLNTDTGDLLLYRHGYEYPKPADFRRQLAQQTAGNTGQRGIVMYGGKPQPNATTHRGTIASISDNPGRGFRMELEIPVQELGEKITFEHNGMKYLKTSMPSNILEPSVPLFGDITIDGYASLHDALSKQAYAGFVTSFQEAFTVFGIDFTQDLKKFFGAKSTSDVISLLRRINSLGEKRSVEEVYQFQSLLAGQDSYFSMVSSMLPALVDSDIDVSGWAQGLQEDSFEAAVARAVLVYLMSPGADVDAILSSTGFYVTDPSLPGAQSQRMPELFTRAFDLAAPDSEVKAELGRRINATLNSNATEGWHLDVNTWELEGRTRDGKALRGLLQYGEAHVTEDNVLLNLMAQERKADQSATYHQALMNRIGTGGFFRPKQEKLDRQTVTRQQDLTDPEQIQSMWRDLTFVDPQTYGPGARWQERTPAEHRYYHDSLVRFGQYRHAINFDDSVFDQYRTDIVNAIARVRNRLQLRPSQEELVHYWIRQVLYHPAGGADQASFTDDLAPGDVLGALQSIHDNLDRGLLPTFDAAGPSFFSYPDLQILFQQYQRGDSNWAPFRKEGDPSTKIGRDNFGEWIAVAFGQGINESVDFDPIWRLDMSGFMNTYQTPLRNSGYMMDITFDKELQGKLLDPKTNEMLSVTIDPVEDNRLTQQVLFKISGLEYDDLMRGNDSVDDAESRQRGQAWRARRLKARARWRARHKVRPVAVQSTRDFHRNGIELINRDADMHSLQRIIIALRHGTAMLNPGLYVSMIPEQGFRMYLNEMTNMLTGESTLRSVAGAQRGLSKLTGGRLELNLYSAEQIDQLNKLFSNLGNDGAFTSLIIKDMMWQPGQEATGKVVRAFERYAALGNKWQDPTWGTTQKSMARHYVEGILRAIESMPTREVMSVDSVIAHLRTDPAYFANNRPDLHRMASNHVVDFRSLKQTPLSLAIKQMYEPWSQSENMGKRFVGTLVKLQAMYATYNANVLTTMTGMQGYSDLVGAFFDGRRKPGSLMKMWWKARNGEPITDEDYRTFDLSTTIDGVTIANSFIKGGVTQTGLFMLGMAFGGILSGEDEEAKRRRRLAEAQNAPLIMDPRRLELDFRNKDVIFLDWLPPALSAFFRVQGDDGTQGARSAAQISWILKPFLSPILGMERFFMTGDFSYVTHGFLDAVGSLPLFNKGKWDDAVRTANELEALAADEQQAGTPTAMKNTMYLLSSAVAVYESMLVENMFINSLYTGFDMYDRDPTKLVLRDSDGDIQRTIENNARPNDLALNEFMGEDGIGSGYMKRDPLSANLAAYTENNFTAAAMLSLFKPFHNQEFFRGDMPVRLRKIEMPKLTTDEAKVAVILATLNQQKAQGELERQLSLDEVTKLLKGEILEREDWDAYHNLDALALAFYESDANPQYDPLSVIGPDGVETLTKSGHAALFKGLQAGTISLDDPEMRGIAITQEQREEIEKDFFEDTTREGRDIGLTHEQAVSRAKRLMYGPYDDPSITGFRDILWDKRIPWTPDLTYKQLNTTFVQGPDGFPWATGYKRGGAPGMGGFWQILGGLKRPTLASGVSGAMTEDGRMNSADIVNDVNTGMRGLVPFNQTELIPTDWEQTQKIIDAIEDHEVNVGSGYTPNSNGGGSGTFYRGGYRRGYRSGGGGYSGRGYSPTIYWSRQPTLPRGTNVYGNFARNLFWNNANIRRTTIRRERYQSSRGRLNQWQ